jgi:hypothetical protein
MVWFAIGGSQRDVGASMGAQRGESSQFGDGDASGFHGSEILFELEKMRVGDGSVDVIVSLTEGVTAFRVRGSNGRARRSF